SVEVRPAGHLWGRDTYETDELVRAETDARARVACIGPAGENRVALAAVMCGGSTARAAGRTGLGAVMGSKRLKAIAVRGSYRAPAHDEAGLKELARQVTPPLRQITTRLFELGTAGSVQPAEMAGDLPVKNWRLGSWPDGARRINGTAVAETILAGHYACFSCPIRCGKVVCVESGPHAGTTARGAEYETCAGLGSMLLNDNQNVLQAAGDLCNRYGLDTISTGAALAFAMEAWEKGVLGKSDTGGLDLTWGNYEVVEKLFFMTARREGFGDTIAWSARAVEAGKYPRQALEYRMAVKGLMQSDPHDARIIKAFALGLAVATRGMDHLRNRVTLEINAKVNDDPAFKRSLYHGDVAPEPNSYRGKEIAVRACEDTYAVGDSVGMCRFTTKLFNSPSLPGLEQFSKQVENVTGLRLSPTDLQQVGLNITGLERMINYALGARRKDDTVPRRWFEEELEWGAYKGEKIDGQEFDRLLSRFYAVSQLDEEGQPELDFRSKLAQVASGFAVGVKVPKSLKQLPGGGLVITQPIRNLGELIAAIDREVPGLGVLLRDHAFNFVVNDEIVLRGQEQVPLATGDRVEVVMAVSGG
ncbi:MAG: MoaD/ThiS family protein, partial [Deltaproteobacteria bacterium]|nr:MoaD/ThiS family protein [Deltaproteobacteria bacterium]